MPDITFEDLVPPAPLPRHRSGVGWRISLADPVLVPCQCAHPPLDTSGSWYCQIHGRIVTEVKYV